MEEFLKIKVEARKEKRKAQLKNAEDLLAKINKVDDPRKALTETTKTGEVILSEYKQTRGSMKRLETEFNTMISDPDVKEHLEKKGILTLKDYIASKGEGEESTIVEKYKATQKKLKETREALRGKVKERGEIKDKLLEAVQENNPEHLIRTGPALKSEAEKQASLDTWSTDSESIMGKEVDKMVGEIIEGHKAQMLQNMKEHFGEGRADFFTTEDFVKMQKFGNNSRMYRMAKDKLWKAVVESIPENVKVLFDNPNDKLENRIKYYHGNRERAEEKTAQEIVEVMKYQFDLGSSDLDRKNFTLDNIILEEENAEKLSVLSTELISITTGFEKRMKEQDNLYSQNILGFHKGGNGMYYVKFGAKSPGNQDFFKSRTIDGNGYILGSEDLTEKIQEVDVVLDEQRKILDGSMDKMKTFQKKNFVSQFFNKSTKEGIQQKTSASRREVSGLESARKALVLAQDFIQAIQDFEKRSGVEVDGSRNSNISSFRQEYLAQLEKKLKPAPKAARY